MRLLAATLILGALAGCERGIKTEPLPSLDAAFAAAHGERRILALLSPG